MGYIDEERGIKQKEITTNNCRPNTTTAYIEHESQITYPTRPTIEHESQITYTTHPTIEHESQITYPTRPTIEHESQITYPTRPTNRDGLSNDCLIF